MASVHNLVHESSSDIRKMAREEDLEGRGELNKPGLIMALADEEIGEAGEKILRANKTGDDGLVSRAKRAGLRNPHSMKKAKLQDKLLEGLLGGAAGASGGVVNDNEMENPIGHHEQKLEAKDLGVVDQFPDSKFKDPPPKKNTSHFKTAEARQSAITDAARTAAVLSVHKARSTVVTESFAAKDSGDPIEIRPAKEEIPSHEIVVVEINVPFHTFPRLNTKD